MTRPEPSILTRIAGRTVFVLAVLWFLGNGCYAIAHQL